MFYKYSKTHKSRSVRNGYQWNSDKIRCTKSAARDKLAPK